MLLKAKIERWHKLLSWCTGGMVLTLVDASKGKGLSRREAELWVKHIKTVLTELEEVLNKK